MPVTSQRKSRENFCPAEASFLHVGSQTSYFSIREKPISVKSPKESMERSRFLLSLLLLSLLGFCVAHGEHGREEMKFGSSSTILEETIEMPEKVGASLETAAAQQERRELNVVTVEDYADPGANTNPRNGPLMASPPPPARH